MKDAKFSHNGIADAAEESNRKLCKKVQEMHDVLLERSSKLHEDLTEKLSSMSLRALKGNDDYLADMSTALRSELGLLTLTVDQTTTRSTNLETMIKDLRSKLADTTASLVASRAECNVLHDSEDTLKQQLGRLSSQCQAQAEREVDMALTIAANADMTVEMRSQLSNYAQQLNTARVRATVADVSEIETALLKAQLTAMLRLLRMRRELNNGNITGLAPPTANEIVEFASHFGVSDLTAIGGTEGGPQLEAVQVYVDPVNGNDHSTGGHTNPVKTMLHAAELALRPDMKEVHVFLVGKDGGTKLMKLPGTAIAVVAEEAMYAPLPDGWQRSEDNAGRRYYFNRWLAGRCPSYDHPLDDSYRNLCLQLARTASDVAVGKQEYQTLYDSLEEFPAVSVGNNGISGVSQGGDLQAFLAEIALAKYDSQFRELGAALPEDLGDIDDETLDSFGMKPLEKKRFHRVVRKAFVFNKNAAERVASPVTAPTTAQSSPVHAIIENPPMSRNLIIVGASGLKSSDLFGASNPYAVIYLDDEKIGQTEHIKKTLMPVWDEVFPVNVPPFGSALRVEVHDHDQGSDHDFLGQVELILAPSAEGGQEMLIPTTTRPLVPGEGPDKRAAQGELTLLLEDPALPTAKLNRQLVLYGAADLPKVDTFGKCDPYSIVFWNNIELGKTEVVYKSLDPRWDARFPISIPRWGGLLKVELYDHDTDSDDFLGQIEMPIAGPGWMDGDIDTMTMGRHTYVLEPKPGASKKQANKTQGRVTLGIENPLSRRLVVMSAEGLKAADRGGKSDPYAVVFFDDAEVGRTDPVTSSLEPEWEAPFLLAIDREVGWGTLRIELYDHDVGSGHDFLGQIEISVGNGGEYAGEGLVLDRRMFPLTAGISKPDERLFGTLTIRIEDPEGIVNAEMALGRPPTPRGALKVTVIEAKGLKKMDTFGKNDPYCIVAINGESRRTKTVDGGGAAPVWGEDGHGEVLNFELERAVAVEVACYDEDAGKDDLIGTAIVELDHAPEGQDWELQDWFAISDDSSKETGQVQLLLSWVDPL
jgi:hypothetical protein